MSTPFSEWLALLAQANKGPLILPPAIRQVAYNQQLVFNGDLTSAGFAGQVKASPDSTSVLVSFVFGTSTLIGGKTYVPFGLNSGTGANSTGALPVDGDFDGVEAFPFDILMTFGGVTDRLVGGLLPLSGFITLPGA